MQILLSPSKTQNYKSIGKLSIDFSSPVFLKESINLRFLIDKLSKEEFQKMTKVSDNLLKEVRKDGIDKPAIFSFQGAVFKNLDIESLTKEEIDFTSNHVILLSALYGVLRPFDVISQYRLDMANKLGGLKEKNLYEFWKDKISKKLQGEFIVNLASSEYSSVLNKENFDWLDITFKEKKEETYKIVGSYSKQARGAMARFIIQNKITDTQKIKDFNLLGYKFNKELSSDNEYVFIR